MEQNYIKLIFGLKLRQLRTEKELSLADLAEVSGISKSYLNEIEKGKKYPKPDKVAILANHLNVSYDELVSLKLEKNLAPITKILESNILKEIPFELFGIQQNNLIEIISNAPAKVNAFISTIIEIARNYNFEKENFYLASVRSFQEANHNFFYDLEKDALSFTKKYQINTEKKTIVNDLKTLLKKQYNYTILKESLSTHQFNNLRSVFVKNSKSLVISDRIEKEQELFIYAKEIAFSHLKFENRLTTFPWIQFNNFDDVLNNFYASYFAGVLLIPRISLLADLKILFQKTEITPLHFKALLRKYKVAPETFFQRLTNILPEDFGFKDLFFLRFSYDLKHKSYELTKELHFSSSHAPRAYQSKEHYCRRWISLKVFNNIEKGEEESFGIQISSYPDHDESYLILSSATKDPFVENQYRSISIGLPITDFLKKKISFLSSKIVQKEQVGVTCERCSILDCDLRKRNPVYLEQEQKDKATIDFVNSIKQKYN